MIWRTLGESGDRGPQRDIDARPILADPFFVNELERSRVLIRRGRVAMIRPGTPDATACAMTYGPKLAAMVRGVGRYVGRVLAGQHPADLPVERVPQLQLVIKLTTAKALGVTVSPLLLAQANEVIP